MLQIKLTASNGPINLTTWEINKFCMLKSQQIYTATLHWNIRITFAVGVVLPESPETIPAAAHSPVIQVPTDRVLHAGMLLRTEVITWKKNVLG